jgi:hypothetical protein
VVTQDSRSYQRWVVATGRQGEKEAARRLVRELFNRGEYRYNLCKEYGGSERMCMELKAEAAPQRLAYEEYYVIAGRTDNKTSGLYEFYFRVPEKPDGYYWTFDQDRAARFPTFRDVFNALLAIKGGRALARDYNLELVRVTHKQVRQRQLTSVAE